MCSVARGKTCAGRMFTSGLVGVEGGLVRGGDLGRRLGLEAGLDEHPVLAAVEPLVAQVPDVGDVLDVEDVEAVVEQRPPDEVGEQVGAQVADVGVAVDRRAARVHPHAARLERLDRLDGRVQRVAQARVMGRPNDGAGRDPAAHRYPGGIIGPPAV